MAPRGAIERAAPNESRLRDLDDGQVGERRDGDEREVRGGQRNEAHDAAERRRGKGRPDGHYGEKRRREREARTAAPRPGVRADDEENECLRAQRLDEPAGTKERLLRVKDAEQHEEREEVEHRAYGPDEQHEPPDETDVRAVGRAQPIGVDLVGRNRDLRDVVEHVVEQDLRREHRQERQRQRRHGHAQHVSEVRARTHEQVLHDVREGAPPLEDAAVEHLQTSFGQEDVRGLARDVDGARDRDAHVGGVQRRRVVDSIAEKPHDVTRPLQREQDARLLAGAGAREDVHALDDSREGAVGQPVDVRAEEDRLGVDSHGRADVTGDGPFVARQHLHRHPVATQRLDGSRGLRQRRVGERHEPLQLEIALVGDCPGALGSSGLGGDREDTHSVRLRPGRPTRASAAGRRRSPHRGRRRRRAPLW